MKLIVMRHPERPDEPDAQVVESAFRNVWEPLGYEKVEDSRVSVPRTPVAGNADAGGQGDALDPGAPADAENDAPDPDPDLPQRSPFD